MCSSHGGDRISINKGSECQHAKLNWQLVDKIINLKKITSQEWRRRRAQRLTLAGRVPQNPPPPGRAGTRALILAPSLPVAQRKCPPLLRAHESSGKLAGCLPNNGLRPPSLFADRALVAIRCRVSALPPPVYTTAGFAGWPGGGGGAARCARGGACAHAIIYNLYNL